MGKGGIGVGSASIVLVFAVLCLTIFSLITLVVARNDRALADARMNLVTGYYEADAFAEEILVELLAEETTPASIRGVQINTRWDDTLDAETIYFFSPISDIKALYVNLAINDDSYYILSWRMYSIDEWEFDTSLNIWTGD